MNKQLSKALDYLKNINSKWLIGMGLAGILLIFMSSLLSTDEKSLNQQSAGAAMDMSVYASELQMQVSKIVSSISGDKNPTVVVTLESGTQYVYADDKKDKTTSAEQTAQVSQNGEQTKETETNYVIIEDASGGEKAVIVTEYMPTVRGVAIVCAGGDNERLQEKIIGAVTAALNISQRKIFVTD